jgi:hypothetical protein
MVLRPDASPPIISIVTVGGPEWNHTSARDPPKKKKQFRILIVSFRGPSDPALARKEFSA